MAEPSEREKQYVEKRPEEAFLLSADFSGVLASGQTLAESGHSVVIYNLADQDVTSTIAKPSTLARAASLTALTVELWDTLATPAVVAGSYRAIFRGKIGSTYRDVQVWLHLRAQA